MKTILCLSCPEKYIPPNGSKSRKVLELLLNGITRLQLEIEVPSFRGSPLEDLEGERYGYWSVERYTDDEGNKCLRLNNSHLIGDPESDNEVRILRRKERAVISNKQAKQGRVREPKSLLELNSSEREYLVMLGASANDEQKKKPTKG